MALSGPKQGKIPRSREKQPRVNDVTSVKPGGAGVKGNLLSGSREEESRLAASLDRKKMRRQYGAQASILTQNTGHISSGNRAKISMKSS